MGAEKGVLELGGRSLLEWSEAWAGSMGWVCRVVREDRVGRCGPVGGVHAGLCLAQAGWVIFLAVDMPFVGREILARVVDEAMRRGRGMFCEVGGLVGFPFVLPCSAVERVEQAIGDRAYSLRGLMRRLEAEGVIVEPAEAWRLMNVNTPEDWKEAQRIWAERGPLLNGALEENR